MVVLTDHARVQLAARGLTSELVERTVADPDWTEPDSGSANRIRAFRGIPERGGKFLRVVYEPIDGEIVVITAFLDRGASRKRPGP